MKPPEGDNPTQKQRDISCDCALHDLIKVKELSGNKQLSTVTAKCDQDLAKLSWSIDKEVPNLIMQLTEADYYKSEWCRSSGKPDEGRWLMCDAYKITNLEYNPRTYKDEYYDYYLKFSIGPTGKLLLIVSCHLQQY